MPLRPPERNFEQEHSECITVGKLENLGPGIVGCQRNGGTLAFHQG